jgi:hypothetical protein
MKSQRRIRHLLVLLVGALALTSFGCTNLKFIKKRLPPPYSVEGGYLFQFFSPSAQIVQLCGSWEWNDW